MRSLAVKIFLSFWIAQVVILVGLEVMRPRSNVYPPPLPRPSPVFIPAPVLVAAVVVSAVVCFLLARHLASPLKRVREASGRLAAGDLGARAGDMVRPRRDEIGDVVRDFDAMAERLNLLVSAQSNCSPISRMSCGRPSPGCTWPSSSRGGKRDPMPRTTSTASRPKARG